MRHGPVTTLGRGLFLAGVASSTWTELIVLGQPISDLLLFAGGGLLVVSTPARSPRRPYRRIILGAYLVLLSAIVVAVVSPEIDPGTGIAFRFALVLALVPLFADRYVASTDDALRIAGAVVFSAAVNGAVAIADLELGTAVGPARLTWTEYQPLALSRAVGLTGHPNVLGFLCASTLPLVPLLVIEARRRWARLLALAGGVMILGGTVLSGSRGAAVAIGISFLYLTIRSRSKGLRRTIVIGAVGGALVVLVAFPDASLLSRLGNDAGAAASNRSREAGLVEAVDLAVSSFPLGDGWANATKVHSGLLAIITSGGMLALAGVLVWGGAVVGPIARALRRSTGAERAILHASLGSLLSVVVFLFFSPIIFHRYAVIPAAIGLAVATRRDHDRRRGPSDEQLLGQRGSLPIGKAKMSS